MGDLRKAYLINVIEELNQIKARSEKVFGQLTEEELHWAPNEESNSIAIIVKHLSGNMTSRWTDFLTTDGEKDYRDRDREFIDDIKSQDDLLKFWEDGWRVLFHAIKSLKEEDLLKTVTIREEPMSVLEAIQRQLVHYSNHYGQILYIGKQIKGAAWKTLSIPRGQSKTYTPPGADKNS
jgi:hypothetical protein